MELEQYTRLPDLVLAMTLSTVWLCLVSVWGCMRLTDLCFPWAVGLVNVRGLPNLLAT